MLLRKLQAHDGDVIGYNLTVVNTGDTPLYNVNITDPLFGLTPLWTGTLAAGAWHSVYPT
ncbi:MAG: DUF7507 domain-containing protein [Candidatus Kariarchaeaceae archaeon]